jgi:hypothetical protein
MRSLPLLVAVTSASRTRLHLSSQEVRGRKTRLLILEDTLKRSGSSANIVKTKYSLQFLSQHNNKKSARSKPLRKDKIFSNSLGEVNRSPMASSDEDEFGRGIASAVDEASDISNSVDGIIDHDEAILDRYDAQWNIMYDRLRAFKESHGHCELF